MWSFRLRLGDHARGDGVVDSGVEWRHFALAAAVVFSNDDIIHKRRDLRITVELN